MFNLLLIEDDPLLSRMYRRIFTYKGYTVSVAFDGEEGWQMAKALLPDLLLLDVTMPKCDGLTLLERLKAHSQTSSLTVVLLTNLAKEEEIERARKRAAMIIRKNDHDPLRIFALVDELMAKMTHQKI